MNPARRVIVALDFDSVDDAEAIVDRLGDAGQSYKVGLELLTTAGPALAARLAGEGKDVFMDLKLFEIPTSVAGPVRAAGRLGATMVTVHAMGGPTIMEAAVRAAADFPQLRVIALTVVTSVTGADLAAVGVTATVEEQVTRLARLAQRAGCHGVVASPQDAAALRAELGPDPLIVTPGVTLAGETTTEHARPAHPSAAIRAGATHVVIGRSLTRAPDPAAVLAQLQHELG
ncbi:orotidine-5'-phosphate decarboxylase [Asanoa ferruginea]|uniref:Orotidine 5'-phosphate decarboxylase n=1 Tax=Asanoa ferruginea TaxID=53367 RepID=A0A3D9ZSV1_9ACTN|nr:orotidine-5'-phosphate decarboxylase [Asanoa ferruginea]REF99073.1 orotidine-5'-phosphate decarboxylase [Asanoa ferruginea]GIF51363.1 orotidine 5'-phosphate decarboxylase [Asanoa ferruginea]